MTSQEHLNKHNTYDKEAWLHLYLPDPELKRQVRIAAAKQGVSMSEYVRTVLENVDSSRKCCQP